MRTSQLTMTVMLALCTPAVALAVPPSGPSVEARVGAPEVPKVVAKIYAANTTNETDRINGPQVVYGATKAASGRLTMVELQPGTKGYKAAIATTDDRLNGSPPIFNPQGKIVFRPKNTPLMGAAATEAPKTLKIQPGTLSAESLSSGQTKSLESWINGYQVGMTGGIQGNNNIPTNSPDLPVGVQKAIAAANGKATVMSFQFSDFMTKGSAGTAAYGIETGKGKEDLLTLFDRNGNVVAEGIGHSAKLTDNLVYTWKK